MNLVSALPLVRKNHDVPAMERPLAFHILQIKKMQRTVHLLSIPWYAFCLFIRVSDSVVVWRRHSTPHMPRATTASLDTALRQDSLAIIPKISYM